MAEPGSIVIDHELIRKIWSKYLRDETKYDKYGALGKTLVIEEVLVEAGIDPGSRMRLIPDYPALTNFIFPRTYFCERPGEVSPSVAEQVAGRCRQTLAELARAGLGDELAREVAAEETAERYCLPVSSVISLLLRKAVPGLGGERDALLPEDSGI